jgi:hypothetical protein
VRAVPRSCWSRLLSCGSGLMTLSPFSFLVRCFVLRPFSSIIGCVWLKKSVADNYLLILVTNNVHKLELVIVCGRNVVSLLACITFCFRMRLCS